MSNLTAATSSSAAKTKLETITTPKNRKTGMPSAKDMNQIEDIIKSKINARENNLKQARLDAAKIAWAQDIEIIHNMAVDLRTKFEALKWCVEQTTKRTVTVDTKQGYSSDYWGKLPETMEEAKKLEFLETTSDDIPGIETARKEIDEEILNIRLGLSPVSDVKLILDRINQIT